MNDRTTRRRFLHHTVGAGAAMLAAPAVLVSRGARGEGAPSEKMIVAVMGTNGRGSEIARGFARCGGAEVATICDVDARAVEKGRAAASELQARKPEGTGDFRRILDDKSVDALAIAAPDHWHAPAAILACAAGKHVYVEKPCSHNPREGELLLAAARRHNRAVQHGTQRRSWPGIVEGIEKLRAGAIGRVFYSRGWYSSIRGSIGRGKAAPVPAWLDYTLWQGPAPERDYRDNVVHYNWHWFWHWGTGEIGNNGVHGLDLCRWGLGVDYPRRVTAGGGRYRHDDDQETPDTLTVTYEFDGGEGRGGSQSIVWEGLSWHGRGREGSGFGASFHGEGGALVLTEGGHVVYDQAGKEVSKASAPTPDDDHFRDFIAAARSGKRPCADIEEAHKSTLLCHLGNIAYRTRRTLELDAKSGRPTGDPEAARLWSRDYRAGWEPKVEEA